MKNNNKKKKERSAWTKHLAYIRWNKRKLARTNIHLFSTFYCVTKSTYPNCFQTIVKNICVVLYCVSFKVTPNSKKWFAKVKLSSWIVYLFTCWTLFTPKAFSSFDFTMLVLCFPKKQYNADFNSVLFLLFLCVGWYIRSESWTWNSCERCSKSSTCISRFISSCYQWR